MFRPRLKAVTAALTLAAGLIVPTFAATPAAAAPAVKGVYVVQAGDETWSDAVSRQIADYPSFRPQVAALLPLWTANAKKGAMGGVGATGAAPQLAQLAQVGKALKNPAAVVRKPGIYSTHTAAARTKTGITPMFVNVDDPNSWAVRGAPGGNGNTYWSGLVANHLDPVLRRHLHCGGHHLLPVAGQSGGVQGPHFHHPGVLPRPRRNGSER